MRKHEYRGKRIDNGQWVFGSLVESEEGIFIFDRKEWNSPIAEEPEYSSQGMGCGLEDRSIHDRYEAMEYGWEEAVSRYTEQCPDFYEVHPETVGEYSGYILPEDKRKIFEGDRFKVINDSGKEVEVICEFGMARRTIMGNEVDISCFYFLVSEYDGKKTFPIVKNYAGVHDLSMFRYVGTVHDDK